MPKKSASQFFSSCFLISMVMVAYFTMGLLGLQLAIPPSQAGAVWPPAGIALASMLYFGPRIWPGIFIGNLCISAWAFGFDGTSLFIYLATGTGASLCAYFGYQLIKRYVGVDNNLISMRDIVLFLLLGGPLSCLIPASIGITSMVLSGIVNPSEIAVNWLAWWVGDSIGVLLFTPISLTFLRAQSAVWKRRRIVLTIPMIVTFTIVIAVFFFTLQQEADRQQQQFNIQSNIFAHHLNDHLVTHIRSLEVAHGYFTSNHEINKDEIQSFSQMAFSTFPETRLIRWFRNASDHLVLQFVEHKDNNPLDSSPVPGNVLTKFKEPRFFSSISHSDIRPDSNTLDLYIPVYKSNKNGSSGLFGVISISLDIAELINLVLNDELFKNLSVTVMDAFSNHVILNHSIDVNSFDYSDQHHINIGSHTWALKIGRSLLIDSQTHWTLWWVIISGLLFTSLLGTGLMILTGRYFETEKIVKTRTAELLKAKNAAEMANNAKTRFLSHISHELRTPLNGILGFTELLKNRSNLSSDDLKKINIIHHCGDHLLTLINDLLDVARIESNKIIIQKKTFVLNNLLDDLISVYRIKVRNKGLNFIAYKDHLPSSIVADQKRLRQILTNLLNNAIKFTDRGSVKLSVSNQNDTLVFVIEDTGCGISEIDQKRIFEPFVQIDQPGHVADGIGLGLAISLELIGLMDGSLTVTSQIHKGSQFRLELPLEQAEQNIEADRLEHQVDAPSTAGTRILIAEDNEINLLLFRHLLEELECVYDIAMNGEEAWQKIKNHQYELALIDLNMPVISGLQLIEKIKTHSVDLVTVAVSAYADKKMIGSALQAGFDHYLTKPVNSQHLKQIILEHKTHEHV